MKTRFFVHACSILMLAGAFAVLSTGCPNPMQIGSGAQSTGAIKGTVLAQGQMDSSGITVTAELTDGVRSVSIQRLLSGALQAGRAIAAQATTDASGAYTLNGLAPGTYTVNASSRDALERAVTTSVNVCAGSRVEAPLLRLTRTGEIAGTVTLEGETNHLGIVVFIAGTSYSAMTAANGAYTMSFVPAGKGYTLVASKAGYDSAITDVNVSVGRTTQVGSLVLAPHVTPRTTGTVFGTARLEGAETSAGVFVYLAGASYISVTDDAGSFKLTGVAPDHYTLVASKEGYSIVSCPVSVEPGCDWDVGMLTLSPAGPFFVIYNGNAAEGGSVPIDTSSYLSGSIVTVLGNSGNLARAYHEFDGWNTQADGNGTAYTQGQTFAMGNSDAVLYASWTPLPSYTAKDITSFGFTHADNPSLPPAGIVAEISGTSISATVPFGESLTNLVATFTTTGPTVTVGGVIQTSGVTANDFTAPVTYVVTAPDSSQKTYTVTVVNEAQPELPEYVGMWVGHDLQAGAGGPFFAIAEITFRADGGYESLMYDAGGTLKGGSARGTYSMSNNTLYCQLAQWYDGATWISISGLSVVPFSVRDDQLTMSPDSNMDGIADFVWVLTRQTESVGTWIGYDLQTPGQDYAKVTMTVSVDGKYETLMLDATAILQQMSSRGTCSWSNNVMHSRAAELYDGSTWVTFDGPATSTPCVFVGSTMTMSIDFDHDGMPDQDWVLTRQ